MQFQLEQGPCGVTKPICPGRIDPGSECVLGSALCWISVSDFGARRLIAPDLGVEKNRRGDFDYDL